MIDNHPISDQSIINGLNIHYGIEVATLTFLNLGADQHASVYKAKTHDESAYFVKLKRGHGHDISAIILGLLHDSGIQQIIPPIKTKAGQSVQTIQGFTLIVYLFVEGQDGFSRELTTNQWVTLGNVLRQVHDLSVPPAIQALVRREAYSPQWREAVRSLYTHMETKPSGDEIALKLWRFMCQHRTAIHQLVDRAEQLGLKIQEQAPELVLCHSDIHGGNVLIGENNALYIVDWDEPIMAPKERDLMFIGGGVANVWNKPNEVEWFYQGYGKTEINRVILAYYRHERIVEDIAIYGQQLLLTTEGGADRMESYQHFVNQFAPQGVVEIAFKTDPPLG